MSESDDIDNTLMISERYLRGRADGPHGAMCARCGQGGEDRQSPPGLASQRPGVNPKASVLQQPALAVAGLHTSRFITVIALALESRSPGTGDHAHHRGHWFPLGLKNSGCKRASEGLGAFQVFSRASACSGTTSALCSPPHSPLFSVTFRLSAWDFLNTWLLQREESDENIHTKVLVT